MVTAGSNTSELREEARELILDHISEGEYFSAKNIRALGDMGGSLLWGAGWAAFVVPSLGDWTSGIGGYRVDFRPETLVIATVGLCLLVIGRQCFKGIQFRIGNFKAISALPTALALVLANLAVHLIDCHIHSS